jgi:hypothetical protein
LGKTSRTKRERDANLAASLAGSFSTKSLLPLLEAASVSPTAGHRGPSIATLFHALAQRRNNGAQPARPDDLSALVTRVREVYPQIAVTEDCCPYDARSEVLVRWGSELFRLLPGSLERPTAMVGQHALLASVIDRVLIPKLGFGLLDAGELILRRLDQVAACLAPHWPDGPAAEVDDEPRLTQAEVDAAAGLTSLDDLVRECVHPDRAVSAAARFTVATKDLRHDPSHPTATFDTAMATRIGGRAVFVPASCLIETLSTIGVDLAATAAEIVPPMEDFFARVVAKRVTSLFQGTGQLISGPVRIGDGIPIHSVIVFNDRQILALDIAAGLTSNVIQQRLGEGAQTLGRIQPGVELHASADSWYLPADAEIARVLVIAGPQHTTFLRPQVPTITLQDLEWIVYSSQRSRDDLWYFIRDLERPRGIQGMFAWDLIDQWEVWHQRKSFYRGGVSLTTMMFSPHAAIAEWKDAAAAAPTERALHLLRLSPLRDWPIVVLDHRGGTEVGDVHADLVLQVMPWSVPVAIAKTDSSGPPEHHSTLWSLAVGVAWKLRHTEEAFLHAAGESSLTSLRIMFEFHHRTSGPSLTVEDFTDGVLTIGWDARLQSALAENSRAVESLAGDVVAHALSRTARADLVAAWQAAPPGVRTDGFTLQQRVRRLPEPLKPHDAIRSEVLRRLGEHLASSGVQPGMFKSAEATELESHTIYPWLLAELHKTVAALAAPELLRYALIQLEHVHHQRFMMDKRIGWWRGFPTHPADGGSEEREVISRTTRVIALLVEEILANPPAGDHIVDALSWRNALAIADLCIESCFRSDSIHHNLTRTSVIVTDFFEVDVTYSDDPTDIDMQAYNARRTQASLPAPAPITTGQHEAPANSEDEPQAVLEQMPELAPIDNAMRSALGFGIDAITGILNVARQWDATPSAPTTLTTPDTVVEECVSLAVGATRQEYAAALDWLTLKESDLAAETIPHWQTETRAKRIATSPFVAIDNGVWVLPWTAESTLQIFANYLGDGRLPWPNTALPRKVVDALNIYRQQQNREAEKECVTKLETGGFVVCGSVRPAKAKHYGIPKLTGEIDALCVDINRSRIWVVEAKDPFTPYSSRQIRRLINDFNEPGKYVERLLSKTEDIRACAPTLAAALNVPDPNRIWNVVGLMATCHPEPAAFTVNPKVPFCLIDDILPIVDQDRTPENGFQSPA